MLRTGIAVLGSLAMTTAVVTNAWMQKKQFYPTVVHLTRSNQSMLILYIQAFVLVFLFAKLVGKVFFGTLRPAEAENLMERTWYAIIDTCLAFTMFRDDLSPGFVAAFTIFFLLKGLHWLCEDRVDYMERSPVITWLFKIRITSLLAILSLADSFGVWYAYERTMTKGATVQLVFGFEYAILLTIAFSAFFKFILHSIDLRSEDPWENKSMYMLYLDLIVSFSRLLLYATFICIMFKIHTLPIFALRPMYLAIRTFRKALSDIVLSRRAINQLHLYANATEEELANDSTCIICREEMVAGTSSKKLPCGHIFHAACLRSWFQRQQTCPTCRLDVLRARTPAAREAREPDQLARQRAALEELQNNLLGNAQNAAEGRRGAAQQNERAPRASQNEENASQRNTSSTRRNPVAPLIFGDAALGYLNNSNDVLQVQNLINNLERHPRPPPPPFPPTNFEKLTEDELRLMESVERAGVEARVKHLREIRLLLDAAVFKMDQYFDGPANPATNIPSSQSKESERVETIPSATKDGTDSSEEEEPQLEGDVENSEEDEPENANELRRRRLEAL
ncbi:Oidioi.mRNA.OKI2018_I69.XSR.g15787.t1.cds [Oikopleura dioica]|uniref:RING-type E3 ubiquitin transferase n=1 Tax=Oikopleura dioica TaxID=34765 RepID=A0ABN7SHZ5_OIKDI|nr:Oidioi.mRNA.OKI2018_I69.XSR.g15787.t1.cds [Oikopleura dioica]